MLVDMLKREAGAGLLQVVWVLVCIRMCPFLRQMTHSQGTVSSTSDTSLTRDDNINHAHNTKNTKHLIHSHKYIR